MGLGSIVEAFWEQGTRRKSTNCTLTMGSPREDYKQLTPSMGDLVLTCFNCSQQSFEHSHTWIPQNKSFEPDTNQGTEWPHDVCPVSKYEFCEVAEGNRSAFEPLGEYEEVQALLKWCYLSTLLTMGPDVTFEEELRYIVKKKTLSTDPQWTATIEVFDVREQIDKSFCFRLKD